MSGDLAARIDPARRAELVRLLEERALLLAPPADLVDRAIARCVRHDLRAQRLDEQRLEDGKPEEAAADGAEESTAGTEIEPASATPVSAATAAGTAPPATPDDESAKTQPESQVQESVAVGDGVPRGRVIAGYRVESLLGKGGMGQVYRAMQLSVQREVAFKVLSPRLASNPAFRERFVREARAAGRLHHPNLIGVHDVGEAGGMMFFSMELVEGRTVKELLGPGGTMPLERALDIAAQTLSALRYAHERGVVHRDIKPDNIMVTEAGLVKVADLGLSRIELAPDETSATDATQAGTIMGTPHYMSPEQGRDAHAADLRSDLYSLGATLYHMLCGHPPFTGTSPVDVVMKAATQPLVFPDPGPPAAVRALIAKLMAKRAEDRPANAAEALVALERVRHGGSIEHSRRNPRVVQVMRRRRLRRLLPLLVVAAISLLALIALAVLARRHADDQAWTREQERIEKAAKDGDWRRALELAQTTAQEQQPGSPRARQSEALRDEMQSRWETWSTETVKPALDQFDVAMRDKRYGDAAKTLRVEGEEALAPAARQQLETRRDQLDRTLDELQQKPPEARPGEEVARILEQGRHWREQRFAARMWGKFAATPATSATRTDSGITARGSGVGAMPFPQAPPATTLRQVEFGLRFAVAPSASERFSLQLGRARIDVGASGVVITANDGHSEALSPLKADTILRLRRSGDTIQASAKENAWITLGPAESEPRIQMSWTLDKDHTVEVGVLPVLERLLK